MIRHPLYPALSVVLGASVWGLYWLPQRGVAGADLGGGWGAVALNLPALALALCVAAWYRSWHDVARAKVLRAGMCFGAGFCCYAVALVETSVLRATILFYLTPIWGTLLGILLAGEVAGLRRWSAIALALPGLVLVLGLGHGGGGGVMIGEVLGLISGIVWAFGAVSVRREGGLPVAALCLVQYSTVVALGALLGLALGDPVPRFTALTAALTPAVLAYSMLALAAFYLILWAMAFLSAGRSGLLMMSEVLVAAISAAILIPQEAFGALEWLGAGLILTAAVIEVSGPESG